MKRSDCLAAQTLLNVARQRPGASAEHCRLVLEHMDTTEVLYSAIHQSLGRHHLSMLQFGVLLVLFSFDPEPVTSADLATYTAVSRSALTEALDHLETKRLVTRTRCDLDRRIIRLQITEAGRAMADPAIQDLLSTLSDSTRFIDPATLAQLFTGYALLQGGASSDGS